VSIPGHAGRPAVLERWLGEVVAAAGMTGLGDVHTARTVLLDDALAGVPLVADECGAVVDVGSGGGTPGIPIAASLSDRPVTLLEANRRKCRFLEQWVDDLPNLRVLWGRAEEQRCEEYGVAVAKALAAPPTALEWCLPLVREGGLALLWVGPSVDLDACAVVADHLGGRLEESPAGFVAARKTAPTPAGFPRRTGAARKRPLA
jgi:16S rRNA (guanine527-N7)-methyltransferase